MNEYDEGFTVPDTIASEQDLLLIQEIMFPVMESIGISEEVRKFPIRFGNNNEFKEGDGYYTKKDIIIKRGLKWYKALGLLAHEYGHELTLTGGIGNKSNLITELSAYNFQKNFIYNFNKYFGTSIKIINIKPFFIRLLNDPTYTIAFSLSFIPLGKIYKSKYKRAERVRNMGENAVTCPNCKGHEFIKYRWIKGD